MERTQQALVRLTGLWNQWGRSGVSVQKGKFFLSFCYLSRVVSSCCWSVLGDPIAARHNLLEKMHNPWVYREFSGKPQAIAIEALESCDASTADSNLWYLAVHFRMCIQEISLSFLSLFLLLSHISQSGIRARKADSMCCNSSVSHKQPPTGDP